MGREVATEERQQGRSDQGKEEEKQIQLLLHSFKDNTGICNVSSRHPWPCRAPQLLRLWDVHAEKLFPQALPCFRVTLRCCPSWAGTRVPC